MTHLQLVHNNKKQNLFSLEAERLYKKALHSFVYMNNYSEALNVINKAIELEPSHVRALLLKGETLTSLGRINEAVNFLNKTITLNPFCSQAHSTLAGILDSQGSKEEALESCEKAIDFADYSDRDYITGLYDMKLSILINLGRFIEAKETLLNAQIILSEPDGDYLTECFEEEIEGYIKRAKPDLRLICS
jgi:tetratricopeptide (TPR) repeat protein